MFTDKNGVELQIGDHIIPDEGLELEITDKKYIEDFGEDCLIAIQVIHPEVYSILPQDNLSLQWSKVNDANDSPSIVQQSVDPVIISEGYYVSPEPFNLEPKEYDKEADKELRERTKISGK